MNRGQFWSLNINELIKKFNYYHNSTMACKVNVDNIPESLRVLIPYIEFFYLPEQSERENILKQAPIKALKELEDIILSFADELDDFLGSDVSLLQGTTQEYRALTELREMAKNYMSYRRNL